jgi:hypothetical protein
MCEYPADCCPPGCGWWCLVALSSLCACVLGWSGGCRSTASSCPRTMGDLYNRWAFPFADERGSAREGVHPHLRFPIQAGGKGEDGIDTYKGS